MFWKLAPDEIGRVFSMVERDAPCFLLADGGLKRRTLRDIQRMIRRPKNGAPGAWAGWIAPADNA
jgi:hypothetical protein